MKKHSAVLAAAACVAALAAGRATPVLAGPDGEQLSQCLIASTTADDQRNLIRWIFGAAAQNPDVADIAPLEEDQKAEMSKSVAVLFERLLTEDCRTPFQTAMQSEGSETFQASFGMLILEAMNGLIDDPQVMQALGRVDGQLDKEKIGDAVEGAVPEAPDESPAPRATPQESAKRDRR